MEMGIYRDKYVRITPHASEDDAVAVQVGAPPEDATPTITDGREIRDALDEYLDDEGGDE